MGDKKASCGIVKGMEKMQFTELYEDKDFKNQIESYLKSLYQTNKEQFKDYAVDLEDFMQEIWCELFEEEKLNPDRAWCYESMKCNALNYCRDVRRRLMIAPMQLFTEDQVDED
jgi:DNA-directed RNA polymerase specialized sigma24 family protein